MDVLIATRALLLVCVASASAWAASCALGDRLAARLDFGYVMPDGKPLFGSHKTWRGVAAGTLACALVAPLVGIEVATGASFGAAALFGDAVSSAVKRRLSLRPGAEVVGLDQLPESLLPLVLFAGPLGIDAVEIVAVSVVFTLLDVLAVPLRRRGR